MARVILIVVALGVILMGVALVVLGAFPPGPKTAPVEHVLPNDRFKSGG